MFKFIRDTKIKKLRFLSLPGALMIAALGMTSCEDNIIYEEDEDCHPGINLRFVYDYHMEKDANAFPANVDCVTVYVFDTDGNYLSKYFYETTEVLRDESYRMHIPLDEGDYHLVVYGGMTCNHNTFDFSPNWQHENRAHGTKDDIRVSLPLNSNNVSDKKLHDIDERWGGLFYGMLDVTITEHDWQSIPKARTETVYLMKDTNNIQVILQELSYPRHIDCTEYDFYIYDDNFALDGYNNIISTVTDDYVPHYRPYAMENRVMGYTEPGVNHGDPASLDPDYIVQVACAEFSTSRLHLDNLDKARLVVVSNKEKNTDGTYKTIIDMPLINYLAATRGFSQNWIRKDDELTKRHPGADNLDQQYLDRQSNWTLFFFLQKNVWVNARVVVNNWTVRENNITLGL